MNTNKEWSIAPTSYPFSTIEELKLLNTSLSFHMEMEKSELLSSLALIGSIPLRLREKIIKNIETIYDTEQTVDIDKIKHLVRHIL